MYVCIHTCVCVYTHSRVLRVYNIQLINMSKRPIVRWKPRQSVRTRWDNLGLAIRVRPAFTGHGGRVSCASRGRCPGEPPVCVETWPRGSMRRRARSLSATSDDTTLNTPRGLETSESLVHECWAQHLLLGRDPILYRYLAVYRRVWKANSCAAKQRHMWDGARDTPS